MKSNFFSSVNQKKKLINFLKNSVSLHLDINYYQAASK